MYLNLKAKEWLKNKSGTDLSKKITITSTPLDLIDIRYRKERFDVALILGNFISRRKNIETIRDYIKKFKGLMSENGVLIIDHGNYNKIKAYLIDPNHYYEDFSREHIGNPGLYKGYGKDNGYCTWPIELDVNNKRMKVQFGKKKEDASEVNRIEMSLFKNEEFSPLLQDVFPDCEITRCYDYVPPKLWTDPKRLDEAELSWSSNFIVYIISMNKKPNYKDTY